MFEAPKGSPIAACTYILEQHVLPNGLIVTGELQIAVCNWNDECYIESMTLDVEDEDGNLNGKFYGQRDKDATIQKIAYMIESDSKMMDFIYEASMSAAEDNNAY
jgi:hypothetical protein